MAKILIVEDNMINMEMANELLQEAGHLIIKAENATDGLMFAKTKKPDLILMDLDLPEMDGLTATKIIRQDAITKEIPVIAFTAMVMQSDKEKAFGAGCNGFISKPIDISNFTLNIENFLKTSHKQKLLKNPAEILSSELHLFNSAENTKIKNKLLYKWHKVLIVDDNPMNTEILKEILEQIGQSSAIAYNGEKALELIEKEKFDLILLDIMMPDMSGFDVIKILKSKEKIKDIPVIFISALNETDTIVKGFDFGSSDYITKPFKIDEVKARILSALKIKDLQDKLRSEKEILELVFKFSADGIVILNTAFEVISCNQRFVTWINSPIDEIINQKFCSIINCPNPNEKLPANWNISLEINKDNHTEMLFLEINCSEINPSTNEVEGYVLTIRDNTKNKEIEKQKDTFVATLTHDLKTPVRAQIRTLDMLLNNKFGEISPSQRDLIQEIFNSNKYMSSMVDNLLTTYKYENGTIKLAKELFDINFLIKSCYSELKYLSQDKNLAINFDFEEENLNIFADSLEIKRVIINLISNAISYTQDNGKIDIKSEIKNQNAIISFEDTGKGLSEEELDSLFNRYTSYAKKFRQVGTGLGLYLSKQILEQHNGTISIESQEGKGSIFTITLPIK